MKLEEIVSKMVTDALIGLGVLDKPKAKVTKKPKKARRRKK